MIGIKQIGIKKYQDSGILEYDVSLKQDNTKTHKSEIPVKYRRQYSFVDLGGKSSPDISYKERLERQKKDSIIRDWRNLLRGLNNTIGTSLSLASFIYGGGWATTRLLNGNKASSLGQQFAKYVLPSNAFDTIGDSFQLIENPSISNMAEVGAGLALGKWKDFGNRGRQVAELASQGLNMYNTIK